MKWIVLGLGNPGDEYKDTRHNVGFMVLEVFRKSHNFPEWEEDKKYKGEISEGKIGKHKIVLLRPHTFMNKSGNSAKTLVKSKKAAEQLVVVHDELDMPLGSIKIVHGRGSGGHRGVDSIARGVGTKAFTRIRVGVSPATPKGKLKKPKGEEKVLDFIMKKFRAPEEKVFKKVMKQTSSAIETIIKDGRIRAMNQFN